MRIKERETSARVCVRCSYMKKGVIIWEKVNLDLNHVFMLRPATIIRVHCSYIFGYIS